VVGVLVNHDIVAVPIPVIAIGKVKGRDAKVEAAKPEAPRIATLNSPPVSATETTGEAAMLPGMIDMEAGIVSSTFMSDPFAVVVDVWGFRVAFPIAEMLVPAALVMFGFVRVGMISGWTVARNVSAANVMVAVVSVVVVVSLCQRWQGKDQYCSKNSGK